MSVGYELVRQVWRSWRHHPWFTACAVVALAVALPPALATARIDPTRALRDT